MSSKGYCSDPWKVTFIIFNMLFWLSGAALVGVGVWLLTDSSALSYTISFISEIDTFDTGERSFRLIAYMCIGVGFVVFIVGFMGCCGAVRNVQCLMGWYIFFLLGVIAAQAAAGIITIIYRDSIESTIRVEGQRYVQRTYTNTKEADYGLNWIQFTWECCGVQSYLDYKNSTYTNMVNGKPVSPYCCKTFSSYSFLIRTSGARAEGLCLSEANTCYTSSATTCSANELNTNGCVDSLLNWMEEKMPIFIALGIGLALLELVGLIAAICVCRRVDHD